VKSKRVCLAMLVFLALVLVKAGSAQELQPLEPAWLRQMYSEGWQKVQEGVLQRDTGGGRFETFGYGAEGLQWLAQKYEQQIQFFEEKYDAMPTEEVAALIDQLRDKVDSLNGEAQQATSAESFDGSVMEACSMSYDATVYAGPLTSSQGVTATADAYLHNDCGYVGNTTAYAYTYAIAGTLETTHTGVDPKGPGTWLDSHASESATGSTACESRAQASVEISSLGIFYAPPEAVNFSCPNVQPVVAAISGPATVTTDYYSSACANVTWTASATGGQPGYTYNWYIGTDPTVQGTGSTFTKSYCNTSQSVAVKVVATDSSGQPDDATFTTAISYKGPITATISGPTSVSSSTSCTTVSWTVSASGNGHSGFSYKWYIGTTLQSTTGATFSKQFCSSGGSSQSVTVKATATASDGHQDTVTRTTSISFPPPPPLTASITGPSEVSILTMGACKTITWTGSATGGTPGYTYSWYIGTSTTVQGTSSTLSKQFCGPQTINVKLVVRDAAAQSANATFTTQIVYDGEPMCGKYVC
jgi:hypothetical protein